MTTPYRPPTAPNAPLIDLDDAIAKMQTGDLMLFHNDVYFESELIDIVTDSWFSHVGVVYRDPAPAPDEDGVYIWQTDPGVIVRDEMGHLSKWVRPGEATSTVARNSVACATPSSRPRSPGATSRSGVR